MKEKKGAMPASFADFSTRCIRFELAIASMRPDALRASSSSFTPAKAGHASGPSDE
jgi:hypothetical protein